MKLAVVGAGIAGNAASWALAAAQRHVVLYEQDDRRGGHSHTIDIDYDGTPLSVDVGFIVYNELNYPEFTKLLRHLGVETLASDMSFSVSADGGRFEWCGKGNTLGTTLDGVFAQRMNALSPSFLWMLREMARFNSQSREDRAAGCLDGLSLGEYVAWRRYAPSLVRDYLAPMGAAIWSTPARDMMDFPAENFVTFFENHRLLHRASQRPVWRTIAGGSKNYVERLTAPVRAHTRLGAKVVAVERSRQGVVVTDAQGHADTFDQVVLASHSDQSLAMLPDASDAECGVLGAVRYRDNVAYLHRDASLMPKRKRAWAAWNFLHDTRAAQSGPASITYCMNILQGIDARRPVFVSLNPPRPPAAHLTFAQFDCAHPQYDAEAFAAQRRLDTIQGENRTWFCGAWTGYGFHEDGLRSGLDVAQALGGYIPWRAPAAPLAQAAE